jgi:hypothetical protein
VAIRYAALAALSVGFFGIRTAAPGSFLARLTRSTTLKNLPRAFSDAGPRDRDGKVALAGPGTVDEQNVALPRNERPSGQISNERSIDWRAGEVEVVEVLRAAALPS